MFIYIVEMLRNGNTEKHSYIVGAFTSVKTADMVGEAEEYWRGGKYRKNLIMSKVDEYDENIVDWYQVE